MSLDLNARPRFFRGHGRAIPESLLRSVDLVKCSEGDLRALGIMRIADLRALCRPDAVVVLTSGATPARAWGAFGEVERSGAVLSGVDPTGAGDVFCAGLLAALMEAKSAGMLGDPGVVARSLDRANEAARRFLRGRTRASSLDQRERRG